MPSASSRLMDISVNGHRLRSQLIEPSRKEGASRGPTLVFLHDALGSIRQWRGFPEELVAAAGCRGLVYDRHGHGGSDAQAEKRPKNYLHHEALVELPEVLTACGVQDALLIGHSDGGSIALIFAGSCPSDIRLHGIITEAAHVFVEDITLQGIRDVVRATGSTDFLKKLARFHGEKTDRVFAGWHQTWLDPGFRDWNIEEYLPAITCPSLILQGADDEYGTKAQVEAIVRQVSGPVESAILPACAHVPHYQARDAVLRLMLQFIARVATK